ncbi:hypothetical protein, partial [Klebsiella pneumoniae]|uniref:hypothetical protein n=1 Tax=Klebsiella pneumoniae TaxID=573 RepID=UPI001E5641E7
MFNNAINKKLACCLNSFKTGDTYAKFDCIENAKTAVTDFDTLWASSDSTTEGNQMNAFILAGPNGKPLTGFYTMEGVRCNEFSEFAGPLQPAKVNPIYATSQMNLTNGKMG